MSVRSVSKPDRHQCDNYMTYTQKEPYISYFLVGNLKFSVLAKKVTQLEKMTTKFSWASNDLESMMLFLSIRIYLA